MRTVLIVDDNLDNLYILEIIFRENGFEVIKAINGLEALEAAFKKPPDLIISDILMPVMDGFTLCRKCKDSEQLKHIPFVFYTATYIESKDEKFALNLGADRFIIKPQEPKTLLNIARELLNEKDTEKPGSTSPLGEEMEFFRQYNEILFKKLEKKVSALETANQELKTKEAALERNEEFLDNIIENIPHMIFVKDAETLYFMRINMAGENMLGMSRDELIGKNDRDLFSEDQAVSFMEKDREVLEKKQILDIPEEHVRTKSLGERIFHTKKIPIVEKSGDVRYLLGISEDITERKLAEEKIIYERNRFQTLLESSPLGVMLLGSDYSIIYVNPKFTEIFGYDQNDIPDGKTWMKKAFPDVEYRNNAIFLWIENMKAAKTGEKGSQIFTVVCKDGAEKIINFIPVQLESGEHLITLEDRTELHKYQESLAYSAAHDALTGLLNRRSLEEMLDRSVARAKRGVPSSLLYMDLDNFKDVNDTIGHSAGDDALITLTGLLKEALRIEDVVFRVGGDEFAVLLEGANVSEAFLAAERLCNSVEKHVFRFDSRVFPLTLSIGLIEIDGMFSTRELLSKADAAMYLAKKQGKNRIVQA